MENQRRFWQRFVSRLRGSRRSHRYIPRAALEPRNSPRSSVAGGVSFVGRYHRFARDHGRTRSHLNLSQSDWTFANSFFRLGRLDNLSNITPKCLTGFNTQPILSGQISYDDYSQNCWLENHLHRFGGLNHGIVVSDSNSSPVHEEDNTESLSENENTASCSNIEMIVPTTSRTLNNVINNDSRNRILNNITNNDIITQSDSLSSNSTVSDITRLYLSDFAFDPETIIPESPPPYSDLYADPPPPYTEISESRNNRTRNVSNHGLHIHDILW